MLSMYNFDMFVISRDQRTGISTLLGVAGDRTMVTTYIFGLFLTF